MEKGSEGDNIYSQKYSTEAYDKEFCENISMTSTVFQPPPREDCSYGLTVKWNCTDNCIQHPTDIQVNAVRQTQGDPMLPRYLDNNCLSFLHGNVTHTNTEMLGSSCNNCPPEKELCVKSDVANTCRNSHGDSLNSGLLYGILPKGNNLDFCMNEQMKFNYNSKEQKVEAQKRFAVIHNPAKGDTYGEASKEQNRNSNNYCQLYAIPESVNDQNYSKTQSTFDKGHVYVDHAVPDFSSSERPNCFIVTNAPQNNSFQQLCMLNTAISYTCDNEIQKNFIKTGATAEFGQDIHTILPSATVNACGMTSRQGNDLGDNPNIKPCYKLNELKLDGSYFPEDMAKLISEINEKLGTVPSCSRLNHVSKICETAKEYCEKYSHSVPISRNAFKNLITVFLQVAYSWVASYESMKDIGLFHPDLRNQLMKWNNSSEALLDVLIFAINKWNYLIDSHSDQLGMPDWNQMATFNTLLYPSLSHTLSENTSSCNFKDCQYLPERVTECCVNEVYNNTTGNKDKTFKRNNSCLTDNNESNNYVNTFHRGISDGENMIKRATNKTESENTPHSSEIFEVQPLLDKNYDTKVSRHFIGHLKDHNSSNDAKSFMTHNNTKTNSEDKNVDVGIRITGNVNMLQTQNRCKKFSKSDFNIKHPGILPITCLKKTNTLSTFDCKTCKDTENNLAHHPENHYSDKHQKLKNKSPQQTIYARQMTTSGGKKQIKRPFSKIGGKRTRNFDHGENCDSDTSETYEYLRPGSYKVPMKCSAEMCNKSNNSHKVFQSSFKLDSAGGKNNRKVLSEIKTCFPNNVNGTTDITHKTDKVQQNDVHHQSMPRSDNIMEKADKTKPLMPTYSKNATNGKRPTVYWNKNEHQLPRCHTYYSARQREKFCHKRMDNRNRNTPVSSLNNTTMNNFEEQMPVTENSPDFSIMKKCKLENNKFGAT